MKTVLLILLATLIQDKPQEPPKNDPTGVWQSDTGTKFDMKLMGSAIKVHLVDGSNPAYLKYDIDLQNTGEKNTYKGVGSFVAKFKEKECRFDTEWSIVVVGPEAIVGYMSKIVPNPATCEVVEKGIDLVRLKKVK